VLAEVLEEYYRLDELLKLAGIFDVEFNQNLIYRVSWWESLGNASRD
jgi:hypothetical protein